MKAATFFVALEIRSAGWIGGREYAWSNQVQAVKKGPSMAGQAAKKWKPLHVFAASPQPCPSSSVSSGTLAIGAGRGASHPTPVWSCSDFSREGSAGSARALPVHNCSRGSELTQPQALAAPVAFLPDSHHPTGDSGSPQGRDLSGGSGAAADTRIPKPLGE